MFGLKCNGRQREIIKIKGRNTNKWRDIFSKLNIYIFLFMFYVTVEHLLCKFYLSLDNYCFGLQTPTSSPAYSCSRQQK